MEAPTPAAAQGRALWALLLATLGSVAGQPLGGDPVCTARSLARYSLSFTGKWSQTAFPKQYPLFRPPAQWSSLLGECSPSPTPVCPPCRGQSPNSCTALHSLEGTLIPFTSCRKNLLSSCCMLAGDGLGSGDRWGRTASHGEGQQDPVPPARCPGSMRPQDVHILAGSGKWVRCRGHCSRGGLQGQHTALTTACGGRGSTPATA